METKFHLRTRALIHHDGKVLVAHEKGSSHTSLPGGHIEVGEGAVAALRREIVEECGRNCDVHEYLGAIENAWVENGVNQWEITHFFRATISDLKNNSDITSAEDRLEFLWIGAREFEKENLLPLPLRDLIKRWVSGDRAIWWTSTIDKN